MPIGIYPRTQEHIKQSIKNLGRRAVKGFIWDKKTIEKLKKINNIGRFKKNHKSYKQFNSKHGLWKGGRIITTKGYIAIYNPNHPSVNKHPYIPEHRLIMEKHLGRYLKKEEIVHHKNGVRSDNRIENLILTVLNKNWHPCLCPNCGFEFLVK